MPRRASNSLTRNQNRLLMAIAGGVTLHADPQRPQLITVPAKDKPFRTQRAVLRGLIQDDLVMVIGGDMLDVQPTQKGLHTLDRLGGYPRRKLPEAPTDTTVSSRASTRSIPKRFTSRPMAPASVSRSRATWHGK